MINISLNPIVIAVFLIAAPFSRSFAQQQTPVPPQITPEIKQKYAAAAARVSQDSEYLSAVEAVAKAQRIADSMFFEKLRKLEPYIKDYADYLEKMRSSNVTSSAPKPAAQGAAR